MEFNKKKVERILMTVAGNLLYASGVNLMINPLISFGFYAGMYTQ